ncbi:helix-hairpin-helix domain-containing protein [Qipengyuania sp. MTN3-11]|uniref:helix-hairpin-helix domain-containing protein n=1 Tax=Qipengyuania sp. MTN3-11 TaxID=3056557 RepID=UPI0036F1F15E
MEMIEANWLLILLALVIGIAVAWYVFHAARKTKVTGDRRDVLDEGAAPAARNQALIDTPRAGQAETPAAAAPPREAPPVIPPVTPAGLAGAGEAVSAAVEREQPSEARHGGETGDDLTRIKGVGPKLAAKLRDMGVTSFAAIAGWSESDIDRIDAQLGRFQGRIRRDSWVEQADYLARGDEAGFAERYGNLGGN